MHRDRAAPEGESARRQDALAFIKWNLPKLLDVFPDFPKRVLIVSAGDPMWRGGLSGPASIFLHSDRPLISENRTSPLLHELVHVALGIRGDNESDWIVEGLAGVLFHSNVAPPGGIGQKRYEQAMDNLQEMGASRADAVRQDLQRPDDGPRRAGVSTSRCGDSLADRRRREPR